MKYTNKTENLSINSLEDDKFEKLIDLLQKGADPNQIILSREDRLEQATEIAEFEKLMQKGGRVEYESVYSSSDDRTLLYEAAKNNQINAVKVLLDAWADANIKSSNEKNTPLEIAMKNGHKEIQHILELVKFIHAREAGNNYNSFLTLFHFLPIDSIKKELKFDKKTDVAAAKAILEVVLGKAKVDSLIPHEEVLQHGDLAKIFSNLLPLIPGGDMLKKPQDNQENYSETFIHLANLSVDYG